MGRCVPPVLVCWLAALGSMSQSSFKVNMEPGGPNTVASFQHGKNVVFEYAEQKIKQNRCQMLTHFRNGNGERLPYLK